MYESKKPRPETSETVEHLIQPQVHSHAMSFGVRDKEVGTSQSDITSKSHGGPKIVPLHKMVHFNVKQSLCCFLQVGSFDHLYRFPSSNREKTCELPSSFSLRGLS